MMDVGIDIGGTFTDLVLSRDGRLTIEKLPSTPENPALALLEGLQLLLGDEVTQLERIAHGSTVATNAILERKGARTALITTQGFRDVLFIGRQNRPVLYALHPQLPPPLIPRDLCYEVPERLDYNGETLLELDFTALDAVLDQIAAQDVESIAVCLLYSYVSAKHERAIRDRIVERGILEVWQVALSSDVLPEFREYERASTVALEAYVRPVMSRYISFLEKGLHDRNPNMGLRVMKSDGGVISAARIQQQAIQTALSGPAAGVIGAYHIAQMAGLDDVITLDMGGTSTDIAIIPGQLIRRPQSEIDGLPLRIRLLDIETIGAGGGSLARVDVGGALLVGPQSAGADPGPVVYGRGGTEVTVSDANAVLGRLDADNFLGGGMQLDIDAAQQAMQKLAEQTQLSELETAQGVIAVANANIDQALRRVSVARGYDPRRFTLVAFGGAGPLHACEVAERARIERVLIPRYPGVLCAFGLLVADVVLEYSRSVLQLITHETIQDVHSWLDSMTDGAREALQAEGVAEENQSFIASLDMRYQGQAYELNIPLMDAIPLSDAWDNLAEAFHEAHEATYGHALHNRTIEIVNLRLRAVGRVQPPHIEPEPLTPDADVSAALLGQRQGADGGQMALYQREHLPPGAQFDGTALIFQQDSTVFVPSGWSVEVDGYRNLILKPTKP